MRCPECNGRGETIYYVETDRDENTVKVEQRKRICRTCNGSGEKPMTNADRIREMSDEELSEFLWMFELEEVSKEASTDWIVRRQLDKWLKQPAEVE